MTQSKRHLARSENERTNERTDERTIERDSTFAGEIGPVFWVAPVTVIEERKKF